MKKGSQRSQSQPPAPEYGLACGVVFFVSGDLDVARPTITRLGTSLLDLLGQASDDASAAAFAKRSKTRWKQFAESVSFESTERFTAVRSSAKEYQAGQLTMVGANASPGCLNLPSFIYAELPQSTDDQQIIGVMVDAVASGHVFLALSDVVLADNPKDYPRSASQAVKYLVRESLAVKRAEDTWLNPEFRAALARDPVHIFDGPNRIIAIESEHVQQHLKHLDWEALLPLWRQDIKTGFVLQALTDDDYRRLADAIATSVCPIDTPKMFWKQDDWQRWVRRFQGRD